MNISTHDCQLVLDTRGTDELTQWTAAEGYLLRDETVGEDKRA